MKKESKLKELRKKGLSYNKIAKELKLLKREAYTWRERLTKSLTR